MALQLLSDHPPLSRCFLLEKELLLYLDDDDEVVSR